MISNNNNNNNAKRRKKLTTTTTTTTTTNLPPRREGGAVVALRAKDMKHVDMASDNGDAFSDSTMKHSSVTDTCVRLKKIIFVLVIWVHSRFMDFHQITDWLDEKTFVKRLAKIYLLATSTIATLTPSASSAASLSVLGKRKSPSSQEGLDGGGGGDDDNNNYNYPTPESQHRQFPKDELDEIVNDKDSSCNNNNNNNDSNNLFAATVAAAALLPNEQAESPQYVNQILSRNVFACSLFFTFMVDKRKNAYLFRLVLQPSIQTDLLRLHYHQRMGSSSLSSGSGGGGMGLRHAVFDIITSRFERFIDIEPLLPAQQRLLNLASDVPLLSHLSVTDRQMRFLAAVALPSIVIGFTSMELADSGVMFDLMNDISTAYRRGWKKIQIMNGDDEDIESLGCAKQADVHFTNVLRLCKEFLEAKKKKTGNGNGNGSGSGSGRDLEEWTKQRAVRRSLVIRVQAMQAHAWYYAGLARLRLGYNNSARHAILTAGTCMLRHYGRGAELIGMKMHLLTASVWNVFYHEDNKEQFAELEMVAKTYAGGELFRKYSIFFSNMTRKLKDQEIEHKKFEHDKHLHYQKRISRLEALANPGEPFYLWG